MNDTSEISLTNGNSSAVLLDELVQKIVLACLLASLSVFTVCGNILVLYAIQTEKYLRTVSNLFILSLAVADLAVGLIVMPLNAASIITGRWPFSSAVCKMWLSIDYVARYEPWRRSLADRCFSFLSSLVRRAYSISFYSVSTVIGPSSILCAICRSERVGERRSSFSPSGSSLFSGRRP